MRLFGRSRDTLKNKHVFYPIKYVHSVMNNADERSKSSVKTRKILLDRLNTNAHFTKVNLNCLISFDYCILNRIRHTFCCCGKGLRKQLLLD